MKKWDPYKKQAQEDNDNVFIGAETFGAVIFNYFVYKNLSAATRDIELSVAQHNWLRSHEVLITTIVGEMWRELKEGEDTLAAKYQEDMRGHE